MFILGVVDFDDKLVFRYILPERLVRLLVNKLMTMTMMTMSRNQKLMLD